MRLALFDVDGTLLSARGAGRRALARAMQLVYGTTGPISEYDFRGKTDLQIVFDVMEAAGLAADEVKRRLDDCLETYVRGLVDEIGDGHDVVALPGAVDLVKQLARTDGVLLGLVTGNIEAGARIKLQPTGLWPYFRTGAFGSDDADRRQLPSLAARRAQALIGHSFRPADVLVIGDTPLDIECARAFGGVAVAVATGTYSREHLLASKPDLLFDDFLDVDRVAGALLSFHIS